MGLSAAAQLAYFYLLRSSPEEQRFLSNWFHQDQVWFAVTLRSTLEPNIRRVLECNGGVITVYKQEALVAASKGSFRSGSLKVIQSKEDWVLWASKALGTKRSLKRRADSISLSAYVVVPLDLACPSSREALLGPAGTYANSCIVVATDGSCRRDWSVGAALMPKDGRLPARCVAVFGQPSSLLPELTGIALALEDCPGGEDLNILTDRLSSMRLLKSM
jgi:hypothetical protein